MQRVCRTLIIAVLLLLPVSHHTAASHAVHPLVRAYPAMVVSVSGNTVQFADGSSLPYDDGKEKSFEEKLRSSDIDDMLSLDYPSDFKTPSLNHDPGRFRNSSFFKKMYGQTRAEIEQNLTVIRWLPGISGEKLRVTTVNDVHKHLQRVSDELSTLPQRYHRYLRNPAGTYVYRKIAGTHRLSTHSYGIAIDINVAYAHYWRWASQDTDSIQYKNRVPHTIVSIFEKHGFIWGGKWYHYDTMHFEYRPELLDSFNPDPAATGSTSSGSTG